MRADKTRGRRGRVAQASARLPDGQACVGLTFPERKGAQTEVCATKTWVAGKRNKTPQMNSCVQKSVARS